MKTLATALITLCAVASFAGTTKSFFKPMSAADLAQLQKTSAHVYIYDANNEETRTKEGTIPGAQILPSYDKYVVAKELPKERDAKLVFYCANTRCGASHQAAELASKAGYKDVNVMVDGIQGWKKSGFPATPYTSKKSS